MTTKDKPKLINPHLSRSVNIGVTNASLYSIKNTSKEELLSNLQKSTSEIEALLRQINLDKSIRDKNKKNMPFAKFDPRLTNV